ncbi:hypothetical protein U1Q18_037630 [Sarracenia purpurea var. burkii]
MNERKKQDPSMEYSKQDEDTCEQVGESGDDGRSVPQNRRQLPALGPSGGNGSGKSFRRQSPVKQAITVSRIIGDISGETVLDNAKKLPYSPESRNQSPNFWRSSQTPQQKDTMGKSLSNGHKNPDLNAKENFHDKRGDRFEPLNLGVNLRDSSQSNIESLKKGDNPMELEASQGDIQMGGGPGQGIVSSIESNPLVAISIDGPDIQDIPVRSKWEVGHELDVGPKTKKASFSLDWATAAERVQLKDWVDSTGRRRLEVPMLGDESQVNRGPIKIFQSPDPDEALATPLLENTCGNEGESKIPRARKWKRRAREQVELQLANEQHYSIEEENGEKKRKSSIYGGESEAEKQNDDKRSRNETERRRSEVDNQGTQLSNETAVAEYQHRRVL